MPGSSHLPPYSDDYVPPRRSAPLEASGAAAKTKHELLADAHEDVVNHGRRVVAQSCLYGVDKNRNPYAVQLARLSL